MDKSMMKGVAVGGLAMVVLGAGAVGGYKTLSQPSFAEVVSVKEVTETVVNPRQSCENVTVRHQAPVQDEKRIAGTTLGGIAGGVIGSQIGGGNGKTLATIAGAAGGAYAGNRVQKNMQQNDVSTSTERRCKTVNGKSQKVVGYKVTYRLDGKQGVVQTSYKPGSTLPVRDGHVVTSSPNT